MFVSTLCFDNQQLNTSVLKSYVSNQLIQAHNILQRLVYANFQVSGSYKAKLIIHK